jgi:hypothetical protein
MILLTPVPPYIPFLGMNPLARVHKVGNLDYASCKESSKI